MELRSSTFQGKTFQFQCEPTDSSSWWTFDDEAAVRNELWEVREGDIVLDIGSGFGSYALPSLACGAALVHTWAVETNQCDLLEASLLANGWEGRCRVNRSGLLHRKGWYRWQDRSFSEEHQSGYVEVDSLDNVMVAYGLFHSGPRYLMKIDTEGAELEILQGGELFLSRNRPTILLENHDFLRPGATGLVHRYLEVQGFRLVTNRRSAMCSHSLFAPD